MFSIKKTIINMKQLSSTIIILLFLKLTFAQTWAPVGAKWYYSHNGGAPPDLTVIESIGDTIINTKTCKILQTYMIEEHWTPPSYSYWDTLFCPLQYTYQDSGIVYIFDKTKNDFDVLYDFSAAIGDSITVKDSTFMGYCPESVPSKYFKYVIDSISDTIINNTTLVMQFTTPTQGSEWGFSDFIGVLRKLPIIENIGSIKFLFGVYHIQVMEGSINCLRCYRDSVLFYKAHFWPDTVPCGQLRPLYNSLENFQNNNNINIYPNPANSAINIEFKNDFIEGYFIGIYSVVGKLQLKQKSISEKVSIDISKLSKGMYFMRIANGKLTFSGKFVKD